MLRPALVCLALSGVGLTTASCGMVEGDPHRFETLAAQVADIRLDGAPTAAVPAPSPVAVQAPPAATERPSGGLRVEVMDPHDLWDARDGLRRTLSEETAAVAESAAPRVARAVVQQVSTRLSARTAQDQGLRPALVAAPETPEAALQPRTVQPRTIQPQTIQLGAYSSEAAARAAWTRVSAGAARQALNGLSPVFERVTVDGRALTRLKVAAPAAAAPSICHAVAVSDPWCARRT